MSTQLNRMPTYEQRLTLRDITARGWFSFWAGLYTGQPTQNVSSVTVGASPFKYVAAIGGTVLLSGGTTTLVQISRDGATFFPTGVVAGCFPLSQGDTIQVTYPVGAPTMTFIPR
jgi:hypothetical protein